MERQAGDGHLLHSRIIPVEIHGHIPPGPEASCTAASPPGRQGREQGYISVLTLEQHLGYARRATEIAVYLERRMRAEQVRESAAELLQMQIAIIIWYR